nr:MAG TPA: hypothetical protein [Caudoviricetes sp.]
MLYFLDIIDVFINLRQFYDNYFKKILNFFIKGIDNTWRIVYTYIRKEEIE